MKRRVLAKWVGSITVVAWSCGTACTGTMQMDGDGDDAGRARVSDAGLAEVDGDVDFWGDASLADVEALRRRRDAGRRVDAGRGRDAGYVRADAGWSQDAGVPSVDAGWTRDGGYRADAGSRDDAGYRSDAAMPSTDAGPPPATTEAPIVCTDQCRYVRAGGMGRGDGRDWANAFSALPSSLERGRVYFVADGTYPGHDFLDAVDGTRVIRVVKATTSDHGTDTGWDASLGDGVANFGPVTFHRSYYVFDGHTGGGRGSWRAGHGFRIDVGRGGYAVTVGNPWGSPAEREQDRSDITVMHLEVVGRRVPCPDVGGGGASLGSGLSGHRNIRFSHVWFHDLAIPMQGALLRGATFEDSVFERNASSSSCHSEGWAAWGPADNITVRHTVWVDLEGTAFIAIGTATNWNVYGNVFMCTPGAASCGIGNGVIGTADGPSDYTAHWRFHHNIVAGVTGGYNASIDLSSAATGRAEDDLVYNNIFYGNSVGLSVGSATDHDYNTFINNHSAADDRALAASEPHGEAGTTNPFVDWLGGDFHLVRATLAGKPLPSPYDIDEDGRVRGADGSWDRGLYEFVAR